MSVDVQQLSRRGFMRLFGYGAPAAIVAPKYFFAPPGGWIASSPRIVYVVSLNELAVSAVNLEVFLGTSACRGRFRSLQLRINAEMRDIALLGADINGARRIP